MLPSNDLQAKDERTIIFCDPDPVLIFYNSVQVQPQSKTFSCPNESRKLEKCTTKMPHFPLTQSKSCSDPKFWSALHSGSNPNTTKFVIVWIQSSPSLLRTHTCTPQSSENLIETKMSLRKINNYQDHNRFQLEKSKVSLVVLWWLVRIWISLDWRWTDA